MLVPPQQGKPFYVYLSVGDTFIASVIVQVQDGKERVDFLSQQEDARCKDKVP
jgi:hypothetical protein